MNRPLLGAFNTWHNALHEANLVAKTLNKRVRITRGTTPVSTVPTWNLTWATEPEGTR